MRVLTVCAAVLVLIVPAATLVRAESGSGKEIFEQMCAGCHGLRGDGGEGHAGGFSPVVTTLARKEYMSLVSDEWLMLVIKKGGAYVGKIATMPAWEKKFSDEEIRSIIAHIRTF